MSFLAYTKPGVSVNEVVSPAFAPFLASPTSIAIVGPAQGYEKHSEVFVLTDNIPFTLSNTGVDPNSISVVDASNITTAAFAPSTTLANRDYKVDTSTLATDGLVKLSRAMQTLIPNNQKVAIYLENSASPAQADGHTEYPTFSGTFPYAPVSVNASTVAASIRVMNVGRAPAGDFTITGAGTGTVTIARNGGATVLGKFQTVYIDYTIAGVQYSDVAYQLNDTTTVALPANSTAHVVKTAAQAPVTTSAIYTKGTTTDLDYIVNGAGATTSIQRSVGTTTMGVANDALAVRVTYTSVPSDYWNPTQCFSQADVEQRFGPAYDGSGNILNPLSFAAGLAFQNGASSVIAQPLFSVTNGINGAPTGALVDWVSTLQQLRIVPQVNVVVPIISSGTLTSNDALSLQVFTAVQDHLNYMAAVNAVDVVAVLGEDSTKAGQGSMSTLRNHAVSLAARPNPEKVVFLSPGAYGYSNPVTGTDMALGGQYAAAAFAGQLSSRPVQEAMTRKLLVGITSVRDIRQPADKNTDAASGLTVIENFKGRVRVRHSVTVNTTSINFRELNVVRAKYYMVASVRDTIDTQVIGQIPLDGTAPFRVQLLVTNVLEELVNSGVLVTYRGVQARRNPDDPTAIDVRFSYLPDYPLNYVNIQFSIDSSQGVVTTDNSSTAGI